MSENQWTPLISLPKTINNEKQTDKTQSIFLKTVFFILLFVCSVSVGITPKTRRVVEEGYDASSTPLMRTGL